ncbi:MAG: recombination mediator RecR [Candidatus Krumholzibacteriia bacterium]
MEYGSRILASLVRYFANMPGIGRKSAQRLALHLLRSDADSVAALGNLILELKQRVRFCAACGGITEEEECAICKDPGRNRETICVVEDPQDVIVLEKTGQYRGLYHVLHGALSPIDGVGPEDLNMDRLDKRAQLADVTEVIIATNPTVEGDATALFIAQRLRSAGCTVTRLARGLPAGGTLEFADEVTLTRALERRERLS